MAWRRRARRARSVPAGLDDHSARRLPATAGRGGGMVSDRTKGCDRGQKDQADPVRSPTRNSEEAVFGWTEGLDRRPREAKAFYATIAVATLGRCLELHTSRPCQGALLECRRQRHARRAAHGRHDGHRNEPAHHGQAASPAPDARGGMAGYIRHGACNSRILLDLNRVDKTLRHPLRDRKGQIDHGDAIGAAFRCGGRMRKPMKPNYQG